MNKCIRVEVVYATNTTQRLFSLEVAAECTIAQAIEQSGILLLYPEIDLNRQKVGIFSQQRELTSRLKGGDRIEIYRPLLIDPKEARRKKANKKNHG